MESTARRVLQGFPLGAVYLNTLVNDLEKVNDKGVIKFTDNKELLMVIETNASIRSCRSISNS